MECNISENVSLPPVLMFHGTKDRTIHPKVSVVVYEALKKYHKEVQLYMLEGADHGGSEFFSDKVLDYGSIFTADSIGFLVSGTKMYIECE